MRSVRGRPPLAIVLVSDGAENVADAAAVREAADELEQQRTALLALGVGPEPGEVPGVELEPLVLPPQVGGTRDAARDGGRTCAKRPGGRRCPLRCSGTRTFWRPQQPRSGTRASTSNGRSNCCRRLPGAHRVTVRVTLPKSLGGQSFTTSAVTEVAVGRVRVLCLEHSPGTEFAFAARALRGDAVMDVTQRFLLEDRQLMESGHDGVDVWAGYDVVVLGRLRPRPSPRDPGRAGGGGNAARPGAAARWRPGFFCRRGLCAHFAGGDLPGTACGARTRSRGAAPIRSDRGRIAASSVAGGWLRAARFPRHSRRWGRNPGADRGDQGARRGPRASDRNSARSRIGGLGAASSIGWSRARGAQTRVRRPGYRRDPSAPCWLCSRLVEAVVWRRAGKARGRGRWHLTRTMCCTSGCGARWWPGWRSGVHGRGS